MALRMTTPHELCTYIRNGVRSRLRHVAVPHTKESLAFCSVLLRHGFLSSVTLGSRENPHPQDFRNAKLLDRRIWAEMKYRQQRPIINDIQLISKPGRKIWVDKDELQKLINGQHVHFVRGLTIGEIALVDTGMAELGIVEGKEALQLGVGGRLVARITP